MRLTRPARAVTDAKTKKRNAASLMPPSSDNDKNRCPWPGTDPLYLSYHDTEWGLASHDDLHLFELLILEGAQAGLSWITVLKKRESYRSAFDNFHPEIIAGYDNLKIDRLMSNEGIIRNKRKIESAVNNAGAYIKICEKYGSFASYLWRYTEGKPIVNRWAKMEDIPPSTPLSEKISREMKKDGFSFVGPTIIYSFMQAVGMVNDHLISCFRHSECLKTDFKA